MVALTLVTTGAVSPAPQAKPILERRAKTLASATVGAGWGRAVATDIPTDLVGFEWDGPPVAEFQVRALRDGQWTGWTDLHATPDEGPDQDSREYTGRSTAGPVWVGRGASQVEVRVEHGELRNLKLHQIRSADAPRSRSALRPAGADALVIARYQWGANESLRRCPPEYAARVRYAVVHHTAHGGDANNYRPGDSASIVRGIYEFHTNVNGWCDIGYNFLVDRYGQVFEGRFGGIGTPLIGAHAAGFNTESTGVALLGEFTSGSLPSVGFNALADILSWKLAHHGVNPNTTITVTAGDGSPRWPPGTPVSIWTISGHRDVGSTSCPGDNVHASLPNLRNATAARRSQGGPAFTEYEPLGGVLTSQPAVVSTRPDNLEVFVRGTDGSLWQRTWAPGWVNWRPVDAPGTGAPAAASWEPGRIDLFVRGPSNDLRHRWFVGGRWSHWESLGGILTSDPAAVSWSRGRIDVFAKGVDNSLMHTWYDGQWRGWESLGGQLKDSPTVASWGTGRLDVFVRGTDNAMYQKVWENGWSPFWNMGGVLTAAPAATSWSPGRVDVFVRGTDNGMWHKWFDGVWRDWRSRGGRLTSAPAAEAWGRDRLDVFVRGTDNAMWHTWNLG